MIEDLRFTSALLSKPAPRGLTVETTLQHFAIVTYWVDPPSLRKTLHPRFEPVCLAAAGSSARALVSVVTFLDRDFRLVACPWIRRSFGQTNYRAYVLDTVTGEQVAWFLAPVWTRSSSPSLGTSGSCRGIAREWPSTAGPDDAAARYSTFNVTTRSRWAPGQLVSRTQVRRPRSWQAC